jgi:hypothetical protein
MPQLTTMLSTDTSNRVSVTAIRGTEITLGNLAFRVSPTLNLSLQVRTLTGVANLKGSCFYRSSAINTGVTLAVTGLNVNTTYQYLFASHTFTPLAHCVWYLHDDVANIMYRITQVYGVAGGKVSILVEAF